MFRRLLRNHLVSLVHLSALPVLFYAHFSQVCNSFCHEQNSRVDASNRKHSHLDRHPSSLKKTKHVGECSIPERRFPVGVTLSKEFPSWSAGRSRTLSLPLGFSLLSLDGVSFYIILSPLAGGFSSCLSREEMLLTIFLFQVSDHNRFMSGVVSRLIFLSSILNGQRQPWLWLF